MPATPSLAHPTAHHSTNLPASSPLQACPSCEALIDTTEREPLETISCPGCGSPLQITGEIAGLQLVEVAGRGGMGVVYKAYDPGLDRYIAIKLLRKNHSADRKFIDQLENEATITASVNDPNVVRVYATGFDRGRFYLAMELVDRGSLDDLIRLQGRVAEAQVLDVGIQIASGLRAAFQHGLIHRDVKPGNILFGDSRTAKIVDFGLAMFANQMEESDGEIWGTPYYVPPEKLDGGVEDLRSDIYSLGAALFHALAGRPPFEAENASLVALKHLKSQAVSLQSFAPWVSNPTAHIINRTLAKNPADRFQSYDDLIHNLEYALEQLQQGGGQAPSRARVVLETDEDRKTWTWVVLGMAVVIVILIGVFAFARPKSKEPVPMAKTPAKSAPTPIAELGLANQLAALASRDEKAASLLETAAQTGAPDQRAWAQLLAGAAHLAAGRNDAARDAFKKAEPLTAAVKDQDLAKFLKNTSSRLTKPEQIPAAEGQNFRRDNHEAAGYLLFGLHNWQNGALEDGAASLRQFRSCNITGPSAWLGELKPVAIHFVENFVSYQMAMDALKNATTASERLVAAKALRKVDPIFATRAEAAIQPYANEISEAEKLATKLPEPALYRIYNKNSKLVLDVEARRREKGAKVHQWSSGGGLNQIWELISVSGDTFKLRAVHSKMVLNVPKSSTEPGVGMWQWNDDGTSASLWRLEPKGDGWFFIRSVCSNQVLAVHDMSKDNGGAVTQWDKPGSDDHYWRFERVGVKWKDWCIMDLGSLKGPGSTKVDGNTITITANNHDVWTTKDSCRFVYQQAVGDFEFIAQLTEMNEVADWTKVGIMVRNSTFPNSRNIFFGFSGRKGVFHQHRVNDNEASVQREKSPRGDLKGLGWIKLTRRGGTFTTFHSTDGNTWTEVGAEEFNLPKEAIVGLAASSNNAAGEIVKARFENVKLISSNP